MTTIFTDAHDDKMTISVHDGELFITIMDSIVNQCAQAEFCNAGDIDELVAALQRYRNELWPRNTALTVDEQDTLHEMFLAWFHSSLQTREHIPSVQDLQWAMDDMKKLIVAYRNCI